MMRLAVSALKGSHRFCPATQVRHFRSSSGIYLPLVGSPGMLRFAGPDHHQITGRPAKRTLPQSRLLFEVRKQCATPSLAARTPGGGDALNKDALHSLGAEPTCQTYVLSGGV